MNDENYIEDLVERVSQGAEEAKKEVIWLLHSWEEFD